MKKLNSIVILLLLFSASLLQSCLDDDSSSWKDTIPEDAKLGIVTIHLTDTNSPSDYYFTLDNGKTIYPAIKTNFEDYKAVEGQRAFAYLRMMDNADLKTMEGYDYNAELYKIVDILTKPIIPFTEEIADSIGDDYINVTHRWIAQGYLTMEYQFYGSGHPDFMHMLNLVHNKAAKLIDEEGYINLEFRHNAFNDVKTKLREGLVSFKLDQIADDMKIAKGLKIRVNTVYDGIQYYKINFDKDIQNQHIPTARQLKTSAYIDETCY